MITQANFHTAKHKETHLNVRHFRYTPSVTIQKSLYVPLLRDLRCVGLKSVAGDDKDENWALIESW